MYKIEYEIGLNEHGRPYIGLPDDYEQRPEDRFFALEICRYMLQDLLNRRSSELDQETVSAMDESERLLGQLGDEVAAILYDGMRTNAAMSKMINDSFDVMVNNIEERDALPDKDILYNEKIFDREIGLRVAVTTPNEDGGWHTERFELVDGITNEDWKKYNGFRYGE